MRLIASAVALLCLFGVIPALGQGANGYNPTAIPPRPVYLTDSAGNPTSGGVGGVSGFSRIVSSAASTNATQAKNNTGRVFKVFACNTTTTAAFIKFYNINTAPTVGTTTVMFSRPVPPASAAGGLACVSYDMAELGWAFSIGIAYALTAGSADSDTTALTAGQLTQVSVEYQ